MESSSDTSKHHQAWLLAACIVTAVVLVTFVPLFICQPLWADATHYDVLAQELLRGRTLYLDVTDTNFPGAVWIHALVRGVAGWRSEVLRAFDLLVVLGIAWMLTRLATVGRPHAKTLCLFGVAAMLLYYFACTPMVHCQRDVWMLLPAAAAVWLRQRQIAHAGSPFSVLLGRAVGEGVLWGIAVWIKPYVIVPALGCWLAGLVYGIRQGSLPWQRSGLDLLGLIAGGLLAGGAGSGWLIATGSWPHFWDVILNWSGEYRSSGNPVKLRLATNFGWYVHYFPWSLLNLLAVPLALLWSVRAFSGGPDDKATGRGAAGLLIAILYLCWFIQASLIQLSHEYVLAVPILIAIPLLLCADRIAFPSSAMRAAIALFFAVALMMHPLLKPRALATWPLCFTRGSSPLVKDRLSTDAERNVMGEAHWQDLAKVADYLRSRDVADGQLACWDDSSHALYTQLKISPSSRFVHAANWLVFFPSRREDIIREIRESDPRFVVTDVQMLGYSSFIAREEFQRDEPVFPKGTPKDLVNSFPWNEPIVFRAGRYLVHEVRPKDAELASNGPRQ